MNERIRELIKQACIEVPHDREWDVTFEYFDKEKFAKLIVRECADLAHMLIIEDGAEFPTKSVAYRIKQHFGVEE